MISGRGNSKRSRASHPSKLASLGEWKMDHTMGEDEAGVKQCLANSHCSDVMKDSSTQHILSMSLCLDTMVHKTDRDPSALHIVEKRTETVKRSLQCSVRSSKRQLTGAVGPQQLPSSNPR